MIRQNVLLTNANKSNVYNLNNDIDLTFPTNLFFKPPQYIELLNLDLNAEINLFGNSNNSFKVIYKNITHLIMVEYSSAIKTDYQLTQAIKIALNNPRDPNNPNLSLKYTDNDLIFDITESSIENVVTNYKIERESFTTAYSITCNKSCTIDFNTKDSLGPLIGFGNGVYSNITQISGTSTQSISAYNYLDIINSSGSVSNNDPAGPYPNLNDVNCKMVLYNSKKQIIPNKYTEHDTTISLNPNLGITQYENIGEILDILEDQLNEYSNYFSPAANFVVSYDNLTHKINIKNTTGDKFGIGFDFNNITRERIMYSSNSLKWYKTNSINNNDWKSIVYANYNNDDILIAVSKSGVGDRIMKSTNSVNRWNSIDSPYDNIWSSMTYGLVNNVDTYIAISTNGINNKVTISNDGFNWQYSISPMNNWTSITYGSNIFVAVASSGIGNRVMTSLDGITWTSQISAADNNWTSICWSSDLNLFVAVASSGTGNRIMTSPNGINWTIRTSPADNDWTSVCWGGYQEQKMFIAVASSGTGNRIMTSTNGINWTLQNSIVDNNWTSICWGGLDNKKKFVAVASSGTSNRILTSVNGINWVTTTPPSDQNWISICWSPVNKEFLGIASGINNFILCSDDSGDTWNLCTISINYNWKCIYSNEKYFFGVGTNIGISQDEYKWNVIKFLIDNNWESICWSPILNLFAAVSSSGTGNRIMVSENTGDVWKIISSPADNNWKSICWGGASGQQKFVAVSSSGINNRVMTSLDGYNWTLQTSAANNDWESVCWSPDLNLFVAVASSGIGNRVMTSTNGINWTIRTSAADNNWLSICWGGISGQKKFVAVASSGTNNRVMTSPDGIVWTIQTSANNNNWSSVTWTDLNKFVAVSSSGINFRIMTSSDGITWSYTDPSTNIQYSPLDSPINIDWKSVIWAGGNLNAIVSIGDSFGNSSGSLHYILGFDQRSYFDLNEIYSINDPLIYENIFADDYVLVCSNIINNATDLNVIGIGNANNIKSNSIIFAIPLSESKHFKPIDSSYYRLNIASSNFSIGYKNKLFSETNPNYVKFYLRLLSGRHITCTSQFSMQLSFLF